MVDLDGRMVSTVTFILPHLELLWLEKPEQQVRKNLCTVAACNN